MTEPFETAAKSRSGKQRWAGVLFLAVLAGGWFYPLLGFFIPLCMLAGLGIAAFRGRAWCDWYCPRGSFYDAWMIRISPKREIPAVLKSFYFRLFALVALMTVMTINLAARGAHPFAMGKIFVTLLTITTTLGILLAVFIHQRSWCAFCPIGTVSKWIGARRYPLYINSTLCTECKRCGQVCPVQIKPYASRKTGTVTVQDGDCLKCNLCIAACPKKALRRI